MTSFFKAKANEVLLSIRGTMWRRQWHPLQCSCLENPMDAGAWWAAVHGVAKSRTGLRDFPFPFHFHALEKETAAHPSVLAWRTPGTGSLVGCRLWGRRVRDDWSDLAAAAAEQCKQKRRSLNIKIPWGEQLSLIILIIFFSTKLRHFWEQHENE